MEVLTVNLPLFYFNSCAFIKTSYSTFSSFFFWVSWFIYCVNVFIWALRMTFLAHVWLLDTKRMYSVELWEDSLSLSLSENAFNYGSHGATHNCSMPKNRVQLSSPVTTNERYKHIISCSLRFVFQFLLADCILSVFTKYLSKTCFIISYVQITKLLLITFKYLFYQEIWIINHWKNCFIFNTLILWIHFKNHKKYNYTTVCREIYLPSFYFCPVRPYCQRATLRLG